MGRQLHTVLAGKKGDMKVYKLLIQTFCIFDKIFINTSNIYSTNMIKTRNVPRAKSKYEVDLKRSDTFGKHLNIFILCDIV